MVIIIGFRVTGRGAERKAIMYSHSPGLLRTRQRTGLAALSAVVFSLASLGSLAASASAAPVPPASPPVLLPLDEATMRAAVTTARTELLVPGTVVSLTTPDGLWVWGDGVTTWKGDEPISAEDHLRIGSVTKTFTATAILQLVQEGQLSLDDPVATYRPDVPNGANITIRDLLAMRSGLYNYTENLYLNDQMDTNPTRDWAPEELLSISFAQPPTSAPDERFEYSNTNYILLGLIAEQLDNKDLSEVFKDRFFDPLGMTGTLLPARDDSGIPAPHPQGYMFGTNVSTINGARLPDDQLAQAEAGVLLPNNYTDTNPSWAWAAGSAISTISDLSRWVEAMANGELLDADLQKDRLENLLPTSDAPDAALYGLGIAKLGPLYGHTGELPGFNTFAASDPVNDVTLVVWTNLAPTPRGTDPAVAIARTLLGLVYAPAG